MIKTAFSDSQPSLSQQSEGGLMRYIDFDSRTGVKSASAGFLRGVLENYRPDKDHFAVHAILVGDGEQYGPNRNGDYFSKKANQEYHPCFVKYGHFFRHHNNSDPKFAIGKVAASCHNDDMSRIELILHGNKKIAEEEYEMVKAGKDLFFSMSCRVPGDYCSICDNFAKNRSQYCDHARYEMGKIYPNGKQAYVDNKQPYYFDASRVVRPADRIAFQLQHLLENGGDFSQSVKAASELVTCGAEWSEKFGMAAPAAVDLLADNMTSMKKQIMAEKLASFTEKLEACLQGAPAFGDANFEHALRHEYCRAFSGQENEISDEEMRKLSSISPSVLFKEMADRQIIFNFHDFCRYIKNASAKKISEDPDVQAAEKYFVPVLFKSACAAHCVAESIFDTETSELADDPVQNLLESVARRKGLSPQAAKTRMIFNSMSSPKQASVSPLSSMEKCGSLENIGQAKILADFYGLYKIAVLVNMDAQLLNDEFIALTILQDRKNKP